jgi:hypothetical protein
MGKVGFLILPLNWIKRSSSWFVGNRHTMERANLLESPWKIIKTSHSIGIQSSNYEFLELQKDFEFWV